MPKNTRTTKKPAPRKPRQPKPTAEEVGRSIGDVLGRKLDDLLAGREVLQNPGFDAVSAWTVEKLGDGVTGYRANYATEPSPSRKSPLDEAVDRLRAAISSGEAITEVTQDQLAVVLMPAVPTAGPGNPICTPDAGSALVRTLHELAERIFADNRRRHDLINRLEL